MADENRVKIIQTGINKGNTGRLNLEETKDTGETNAVQTFCTVPTEVQVLV